MSARATKNGTAIDEDFVLKLRDILVEVGVPKRTAQKLELDTNFFENGLLDSVSLVAMAVKIEKTFGVRVPTGDFDPGNFATPRAVHALIERRSRK